MCAVYYTQLPGTHTPSSNPHSPLHPITPSPIYRDRLFYRDWWNARTIESYWRNWNLPVHHWLLRHVYYPSMRMGLGKGHATMVVFCLSAVLHEVCVSVLVC